MRLGLALAMLASLLAGCDRTTAPSPLPQRGLLRVTAVEVVVMESFPPQVRARVTGEIPNVCTAIDRIEQRREDRTITLTIGTLATSEVCILLLPPPVELDVSLDGPFEFGDYLLSVNGVERRFRI